MEMACQGHDGLLLRAYSWRGDIELRALVSSPSLLAAWGPLTQGGWLGAVHHVSPRTGLRSGLTGTWASQVHHTSPQRVQADWGPKNRLWLEHPSPPGEALV